MHFRNFSRLELPFSAQANAIIGGNGQGKTNLLEGIFCLFAGSSFRSSDDRNLIRWQQDGFYLCGEVEAGNRLLRLEVSFSTQAGKERKVNGQRTSLSDRNEPVAIAVFSSQDIRLVQDGPFYRRDFLDETCSFCTPGFTGLRSSYYRILAQRNALLASTAKDRSSRVSANLEVWDEQYAEIGAGLIITRLHILSELARHLGAIVQDVCEGVREVELAYRCSFLTGLGARIKRSDIASALRERLRSSRIEEIERGMSLSGPHRDEFRILVNGVDQRFFGSHGQQKAVAVALKLAQVMLMKEKIGEWPVVLLDDLFSNFDQYHRERLVSVLANQGQLFITAQHPAQVPSVLQSQARVFAVRQGQVVLQDER